MATLSLLPAEIIVLVFKNCHDFHDAVALASSCETLYSSWRTNNSQILWSVGKSSIIAFEYALLAVSYLSTPEYVLRVHTR